MIDNKDIYFIIDGTNLDRDVFSIIYEDTVIPYVRFYMNTCF